MSIRSITAWAAFVPGTLFTLYAIVTLNPDGLTVAGAMLLAYWAWGIRAFTLSFWAVGGPVSISRLDELDGVSQRATNHTDASAT